MCWCGSCVHTVDVFYWCKANNLFTDPAFSLIWQCGCSGLLFFWHFAKHGCRKREKIILSQFRQNKICKESAVTYSAVWVIVFIKCYVLETSRLWQLKLHSRQLNTFIIKTVRNCSSILTINHVLHKGVDDSECYLLEYHTYFKKSRRQLQS